MAELVVGPMLRYTDSTTASIWMETSEPGSVEVAGVTAATFTVHGHHYAIADVTGAHDSYSVLLNGERVWPLEGMPPSRIRPLPAEGPSRLAFGSCRTSAPHDAANVRTHGEDVLRSYGRSLMDGGGGEWPDLLILLGDQVYADNLSPEMKEYIAGRRDTEPQAEIADFEEYAELYRRSWTDPELRWLLSTVPTAMIFDDHDLRDDWNTSASWREKMASTSWWQRRVVAGLGAYWVYQHLGNLPPDEREADPLLRELRAGDGTAALDAFAARADAEPASNRWSYARDLGGGTRLIMVDTRCARQLTPGDRRMLDDSEWAWLEERLAEPAERLIIGSSIPYLLPEGVHAVQNWNEALCDGAWGRTVSRWSEGFRQAFDLEHWAAFRRSFDALAHLLVRTGKPVVILSGDVHFSYLARSLNIRQVVCSPIRNPLSRTLRLANVATQFGVAGALGGLLARMAGIPKPPIRWRITDGPWFQNALAVMTLPDEVTWWQSSGGRVGPLGKVSLK